MIHILSDIVVILALASAVLVICHRLRIPSILGLILTGILIGPHGLELVSAADQVEVMAEIGYSAAAIAASSSSDGGGIKSHVVVGKVTSTRLHAASRGSSA